jgi:hypothetical protein
MSERSYPHSRLDEKVSGRLVLRRKGHEANREVGLARSVPFSMPRWSPARRRRLQVSRPAFARPFAEGYSRLYWCTENR